VFVLPLTSKLKVSKALFIRDHALAIQFTDKLFEVFDDEIVSWDAAKAIGNIAGVDDVLTKRHYSVLRVCRLKFILEDYVLSRISSCLRRNLRIVFFRE
jgi:hypothetical protein